jgi:hypothetical protein
VERGVFGRSAGPDEGVFAGGLGLGERGVDRSGEARIVQLDRDVVTAFAAGLFQAAPISMLAELMRKSGDFSPSLSTGRRVALVLRVSVLMTPVNSPLLLAMKVPIVAMS